MNFLSFFMDSIRVANQLEARNPQAGLEIAEQLINNNCIGNQSARVRPSAFSEDNGAPEALSDPTHEPANNATASHSCGDGPALQTDVIESLAVANSKSPKLSQEPPLESLPEPSSRVEPKWADDHDQT
jgi:hypothetical protein